MASRSTRSGSRGSRSRGGFDSKLDLQTSGGLYKLAQQSGLQKKADQALKDQRGENPGKIFSGGFISDSFDLLNSLQYGTVGMIKGKSFAEGVKTRQSFTDDDALGNAGVPGAIGGLALDILFDPLTYAGGLGLISKASKATGLAKLGKAAKGKIFGKMVRKSTNKVFTEIEGGTTVGKYLARKFTWMFGADKTWAKNFTKGQRTMAVTSNALLDLGKSVSKISAKTGKKLLKKDETGRFIRVSLEEAKKALSPEEFESVSKIFNIIDSQSDEMVRLGLISKETVESTKGQYLKTAFEEFELLSKKSRFGTKKAGIGKIFQRKKGMTPERLEELGQIDNPAYLLFKSAFDQMRDIQNAKLLRKTYKSIGQDVAQSGAWKQMPSTKKWGDLAGKWVPDNVAGYLDEIIEPASNTLARRAVAHFKFFKVIMNPATHARNIMSNQLLNYWKLGMNPLDPRVWGVWGTAGKQMKSGGKWIDEASKVGYNVDTFISQEVRSLLEGPEALAFGKNYGKGWKAIQKKLGDLYQGEENFAKLSAYIFNRQYRNLNPEKAWMAAESATFNYAQVTPFVRKLRESMFGFPFITFTVKATPVAVKTALTRPHRISAIGKVKTAIESLSDPEETARERAAEPPWVRDGFYVKLPMKDKDGRSAYFDLTYIMPFGDLVSGNFIERGFDRETGLKEGIAQGALRKTPFFSLVSELAKNKDFFGNKIWKASDPQEQQLADLMRHLVKTYGPPLATDQLPGGYNERGERQFRGITGAATQETEGTSRRNLMQEMMRLVGAKITPVDVDIQEQYQEWNNRKALETVLRENFKDSNLSNLSIPFIKK